METGGTMEDRMEGGARMETDRRCVQLEAALHRMISV